MCEKCKKGLNSWDKRIGKVLGYNLCEKCIAAEYSMSIEEFRQQMEDFFGMRPCQGI